MNGTDFSALNWVTQIQGARGGGAVEMEKPGTCASRVIVPSSSFFYRIPGLLLLLFLCTLSAGPSFATVRSSYH